MSKKKTSKKPNLPAGAGILARRFPEVWESYAILGERCAEAGPLEAKIRHIALLAIPTLGLPGAVRTMTWMDDILESPRKRR